MGRPPKNPASTPGTALAKAKPTLPATINQEMADEVAALQSRLAAPSGDRIALTKQHTFKMPNGEEADSVAAIVVDFISMNAYYNKPYVKGEITAPDCFAIGLEPTMLVPSPNSPDIQAETCAACWANQFKSHQNGKGKACNNNKLLALLPPDADVDTPFNIMKVPTTSVKAFDGYVGSIARAYQRPVRAVITEFTSDEKVDWENVRFGNPEPCTKEQLALAHSRKGEAMQRLTIEPDVASLQAQASAKALPPPKKPTARGRPTTRK